MIESYSRSGPKYSNHYLKDGRIIKNSQIFLKLIILLSFNINDKVVLHPYQIHHKIFIKCRITDKLCGTKIIYDREREAQSANLTYKALLDIER